MRLNRSCGNANCQFAEERKLTTCATSSEPAVIPDTQIKQAPEIGAPVLNSATMFVGHSTNELIIKETALAQRRIRDLLSQIVTFHSAEPLVHRRAKPTLRFVENIMRQNRFKGPLQDVLAGFSARGRFIAYSIR